MVAKIVEGPEDTGKGTREEDESGNGKVGTMLPTMEAAREKGGGTIGILGCLAHGIHIHI